MLAYSDLGWYNAFKYVSENGRYVIVMAEPQYRLEGIVRTKSELMEDFEGPLDVILELLSKNKIEIQDVSITAILTQYLSYLEEM